MMEPTCTCIIAGGWGIKHMSATNPELNSIENIGDRVDEKGRKLCQVHNPQLKEEYESRATGGQDNIPRI